MYHEAPHLLGGILLHFVGDVGVGVQREPRAVVAQDAGHRLGVHSLLDCQRGEGVSEPVERDVFGDSCLFQKGFVQPPQAVRAVDLARHRGREHHRVAGVLGVLLHQQVHRFFREADRPHRVLVSNLDPGTTIVARETRAKEGYLLDDVPQTVTIEAGRTAKLEFRNQPKGSVTLYKFSSADRRTPLEGVGFKITFADGKVVDNIGGKLSSNGIYYTDVRFVP